LSQALLVKLLLIGPVLLFSIIAHEIAHGYAALKQGDTTAYALGRLTWNPLKHIDLWMSVLLPLLLLRAGLPVIAGAKPVPVNPRNYRDFKRGDIIVSLAGVTANVAIAIGCAIAVALFGVLGTLSPLLAQVCGILQAMANFGILLNLWLAVFNLIPIPPLDGSHVVKYLLPPSWALRYQQIGFYGIFVLVLLLYLGQFLHWGVLNFWIQPAVIGYRLLSAPAAPLMLPTAQHWLGVLFG
jgi:Zn-dependent protease